jgi:acetyl-CoA hydrolase
MPSQQAEKDAVDTLLFMSSPNNSGTRPRARTDAAYTGGPLKPGQYHNGPLREDVPARRVMFENHIINGKTGEERQPVPQSNGHQPIYPREETGR